MSLQTCSLIVCVFLAQVAAGTGVLFVMERHPDNYFCGHLQCLADFTHTDHDVYTFVEMTIYDIKRVTSELRLASVSTFDPDLYVDTTKSSAMGCTGTISRLKANLTLQLRHDIDCLYGVYKCQLDFVTVSGLSEVLTEIVTPEYNHSYSRMAEVLSHFDRLAELLNSFTILMNNQRAQINRLTSQIDNQTAQLVNQTTQLNRLASQSDDQTAHLNNISQRRDLDQADQKQRHEAAENRLKLLQEKLDTVEELLHLGIKPVPDLPECRRGQLQGNGRQRIVLWDNITALCDTTTDGGGWVIIQRRVQGDVDFYRGWNDYKKGFGTPYTDLWIGNDIIHNLTSQGYNELRIDFVHNRTNYFAQYTNFGVADESSNYRITISGFSGNVHDSMAYHNGANFSTTDRDNDQQSWSCSMGHHGSWWYKECYRVHLNGVWGKADDSSINWYFGSSKYLLPLTFTEMKIRYVENAIS